MMKPTSTIFALTFLLALASSVANAQVAKLACDGSDRGYIAEDGQGTDPLLQEGHGYKIDEVDVSKLIVYKKGRDEEFPYREDSKTERKTCGPFTIVFTATWLNPDTRGEQGAEQFAQVELLLNGKPVAGPFSLGPCSFTCESPSRQDDPKNWATSIQFFWGKDYRRPTLFIERSYTERREL